MTPLIPDPPHPEPVEGLTSELRGCCRLVAGMAAHETILRQAQDEDDVQWRAFMRGFRWQFGREVSRVTSDETFRPKSGPCGRGRGRMGPRAEWRPDEAGLAIAAAKLIPQAEIARRLNRTHQALRNLLNRHRKQEARRAERPTGKEH
jgi:hypothetical protein